MHTHTDRVCVCVEERLHRITLLHTHTYTHTYTLAQRGGMWVSEVVVLNLLSVCVCVCVLLSAKTKLPNRKIFFIFLLSKTKYSNKTK